MKTLSVRQPWAEMIAQGEKDIEYRTWKTDYRGPLLICSSSSWGADEPCPASERDKYPRGVAVCVVDLVDVQESEEEPGLYEWLLEDPGRVEPVTIKGKLHLFEVDENMLTYTDKDENGAQKKVNAENERQERAKKENDPLFSGKTIKALTVRQPYATWIDDGDKTVEVRAFSTDYRGDLLIVAGNSVVPDAMEALEDAMKEEGVDVEEWGQDYPLNAMMCVVTLKDVVPLEEKHLEAACYDDFPESSKPQYAWILENPRPLMWHPFHGRLRLYDVPIELLEYAAQNEQS